MTMAATNQHFFEDRSRQKYPDAPEIDEKHQQELDRNRGQKRSRVDEPRSVWTDKDDDHGVGVFVDIRGTRRNRKLRESVKERKIPETVYQQRIRDYYSREGGRSAPGSWAELPSEKLAKRMHISATFRGKLDSTSLADECSDGTDNCGTDPIGTNSDALVDRLMRSTGHISSTKEILARGTETLQPGVLDIRQVKDANAEEKNRSVVNALEFHPSGRLLVTGGLDSTLRLFHVDGKRNSKVQGVHFRDLPIHSARFAGGGEQVIVSGRRPHFYQFDLGSGVVDRIQTLQRSRSAEKSLERLVVSQDGQRLAFIGAKGRILIVSNKTKQQIGMLHLNESCGSACFSVQNDHQIITTGKGGTVYLWDVRKYECVDKHMDEGALLGTALACSDRHYAIGQDSGVVNVYNSSSLRTNLDVQPQDEPLRPYGRAEKPERALLNLSTSISAMSFNCDGNLLAMASRTVKDAIKIVHIPSLTVYGNWPTRRVALDRVSAVAFSRHGGYLAVGNDHGRALLFRIRHGYAPN